MTNRELLTVQPTYLRFPFELKKNSFCPLYLTNKTDNYVAFKVKMTTPKLYRLRPRGHGVLLPRSTREVRVIMKAQEEAPENESFSIHSVIASRGLTSKEVTREMFRKEAGHQVKQTKLKVTYTDFSDNNFLTVQPPNLLIPFELKKQISGSIYLMNETDNNVAFKVNTMNPTRFSILKYFFFVEPNCGVLLPGSSCEVRVTLQAQKKAPLDMQSHNLCLVQSVIVSPRVKAKDVTPEMFGDKVWYLIRETKVGVTYVLSTTTNITSSSRIKIRRFFTKALCCT